MSNGTDRVNIQIVKDEEWVIVIVDGKVIAGFNMDNYDSRPQTLINILDKYLGTYL